MPILQHYAHIALLAQGVHIVRDHDQAGGLPLLGEDIDALLFESGIPYRGDLIGEVDIEIKGHAHREGKLGFHTTGVALDGQFKVLAYLRELFDPLLHGSRVVHTVDPADEAGIFPARHATLKATAQGQRPGNPAMARHFALVGHIHAAEQPQQRRFTGAVGTENADIAIPRQGEADIF